jgi:TrpR-related protein YerC/YecD
MRQATDAEYKALYEAFAALADAGAVETLLVDLCTIREIDEMAQRLEVARLLNSGLSYNQVQELTGASSTTVSRVSKCLNYGAGGYRSVLRK